MIGWTRQLREVIAEQNDEINRLREQVDRMNRIVESLEKQIERLRYSDQAQRALVATLRDVNRGLDERLLEVGE